MVGFFSLVTLVSSFKFLWAPFVDHRGRIPILTTLLGHRRSWMLVCQGVIMLGLWLLAAYDPTRSLGMIATFAVLVGLAAATQDIAIDAWRIEAAEVLKQGAMAAAYQWGYRVGIITAGAVPLLLADSYGWNVSYAVMSVLMTVGMAAVLAAPREQQHAIRPIETAGIVPAPARETLEWVVRLAVLGFAALVLGSGLEPTTCRGTTTRATATTSRCSRPRSCSTGRPCAGCSPRPSRPPGSARWRSRSTTSRCRPS